MFSFGLPRLFTTRSHCFVYYYFFMIISWDFFLCFYHCLADFTVASLCFSRCRTSCFHSFIYHFFVPCRNFFLLLEHIITHRAFNQCSPPWLFTSSLHCFFSNILSMFFLWNLFSFSISTIFTKIVYPSCPLTGCRRIRTSFSEMMNSIFRFLTN